MPNIKSAKKRVLVAAKKARANKAARTNLKTVLKKADAAGMPWGAYHCAYEKARRRLQIRRVGRVTPVSYRHCRFRGSVICFLAG